MKKNTRLKEQSFPFVLFRLPGETAAVCYFQQNKKAPLRLTFQKMVLFSHHFVLQNNCYLFQKKIHFHLFLPLKRSTPNQIFITSRSKRKLLVQGQRGFECN